jgi:uncharacterized membrane protein
VTEQPESLAEAIQDRDITLALTPGQLILLVIGAWLIVRVIRGLRG